MTESSAADAGHARCAVHPARPAADRCPSCERPRCGPDADRYDGSGCAVCVPSHAPGTPASMLERVVRSGLAAYAVTLAGGWIATQWVDVHVFAELAPALVGLASGWAATTASGRGGQPRVRLTVLAVAALGAVLSAALAFRVGPDGGQDPLGSWGEVAPPYLSAVLGTLAWPIAFAPSPKATRGKGTQPSAP